MTAIAVTHESKRSGTAHGWAIVQYVYVAWFVIATGLALWRAAQLAGEFYLPAQGDAATGNAFIWDTPFLMVVQVLLSATAGAGPLLALFSVIGSAVVLLRGRGSRRLLISTILLAATVVLSFIPAGQQVRFWILD